MQGGSCARGQCPRCLMQMQLTYKVIRCTSVDGLESNVTVVKMHTDYAQCNRFGSVKCETLQELTMLDTYRSMESAWSSSMPSSLTESENFAVQIPLRQC